VDQYACNGYFAQLQKKKLISNIR